MAHDVIESQRMMLVILVSMRQIALSHPLGSLSASKGKILHIVRRQRQFVRFGCGPETELLMFVTWHILLLS